MNTTPNEQRLVTERDLGRAFFAAQDRLKGGPDPELCCPDYTARIGGGAPVDRAGHEGFARAFYAGFPDVRHELERVVAGDDHVVVRAHLVGTHTGSFFGIPATGRPVSVAMHVILELRDGKVSKLFGLFDEAGLLRQLGALPAS
jgi:predicted ester cyclase